MNSKAFVAKQGWSSCYSGGNRKAAVAVLVLMLAGSSHGQGYGVVMGLTKLPLLSKPWPPPPTHIPFLLPLVHELATCPADTKAA